jgi:hypothetical protein
MYASALPAGNFRGIGAAMTTPRVTSYARTASAKKLARIRNLVRMEMQRFLAHHDAEEILASDAAFVATVHEVAAGVQGRDLWDAAIYLAALLSAGDSRGILGARLQADRVIRAIASDSATEVARTARSLEAWVVGTVSGAISFRGIAREGRAAAHASRNRVLAGTGIAGLSGDPNLCTDPGWAVARTLLSNAGPILDRLGGDDAGVQTAGDALSLVGDAWAAGCMADARGSTTGATPSESVEDVLARARAEMERDAANARAADLDVRMREAALQSERDSAASGGVSQQTLLIAGGVAVAALAAVLLLRR